MLTREKEGSKKTLRKVVQDFVHQHYVGSPIFFMTDPKAEIIGML